MLMFRMKQDKVDLNFENYFTYLHSETTRGGILKNLRINKARLESRKRAFSRMMVHWYNRLDERRDSDKKHEFEKCVDEMLLKFVPTPEFSLKETFWRNRVGVLNQ